MFIMICKSFEDIILADSLIVRVCVKNLLRNEINLVENKKQVSDIVLIWLNNRVYGLFLDYIHNKQ